MDAKNLRDSKISNIAITVDKVMHVLKSMDTDEPPIKEMTFKEVITFFFVIDCAEIWKDMVWQR